MEPYNLYYNDFSDLSIRTFCIPSIPHYFFSIHLNIIFLLFLFLIYFSYCLYNYTNAVYVETLLLLRMLTTNASIICHAHAAVVIEGNCSHFSGASSAVLIVTIILWRWIWVVAINIKGSVWILKPL